MLTVTRKFCVPRGGLQQAHRAAPIPFRVLTSRPIGAGWAATDVAANHADPRMIPACLMEPSFEDGDLQHRASDWNRLRVTDLISPNRCFLLCFRMEVV